MIAARLTLLAIGFLTSAVTGMPTTNLNGCQVLSFIADTPLQLNLLKTLINDDSLDFWTTPVYQGSTDVMVAPSQLNHVTSMLKSAGLKWSIKISDVGRTIREQTLQNLSTNSTHAMTWTSYHGYETIVTWLESLVSHELVTLSIIGQSYEGRNIHQLKISTGLDEITGKPKPAIFFDSLLHAREWVSGAASTWIINEILTNQTNYKSLLSKFDLFFVPVANPDGYEYSRTSDGNRLWRKTRSPNAGSSCYGVDLNRNFGVEFGKKLEIGGEGTSSNPCSDIYKGPKAFSESEAQAVRNAITTLQAERTVHAYFTIHSYGQYFLLPWGYTRNKYPDDYSELLSWGKQSIAAIAKVHGKKYQTGTAADMLGPAGGASDDWAKNEGIKYVTTLEVRDTGDACFLLPPAQIIPTAQEIWAGIQIIETTLDS